MGADVRERLLGEAVRFFHEVRGTPGVRSIALLGSITTPKPAPKDIDFLLAVAVSTLGACAIGESADQANERPVTRGTAGDGGTCTTTSVP